MANNSRYLPYHVRINPEYAQSYLAKQHAARQQGLLSAEKTAPTPQQQGPAQGSDSAAEADVAAQAARIAQLEVQYRFDDERVLRAVTAAATSRGGARAVSRRRCQRSQRSPTSPTLSAGLLGFPRTSRSSPTGAFTSFSPTRGLPPGWRSPASPSKPAAGLSPAYKDKDKDGSTSQQGSPAVTPGEAAMGGTGAGAGTAPSDVGFAVTGASLGSSAAASLSPARASPARIAAPAGQHRDHFVRYWDGRYWIDRPYAAGTSAAGDSGSSGGPTATASGVGVRDRYVNANQAVALATERNVHGGT